MVGEGFGESGVEEGGGAGEVVDFGRGAGCVLFRVEDAVVGGGYGLDYVEEVGVLGWC